MLRLKDGQIGIWESVLPEPLRTLPEELAKVDKLLDDDRFLEPFLKYHHKRIDPPNISNRSNRTTKRSFNTKIERR